MKKKHYLRVIAGLIILNISTITIVMLKPAWLLNSNGNESVASIGNETITRQEWLNEMEQRHGETVLKDLIDHKVIEQIAEKYDITVNKKEINREMAILKTTSYIYAQNDDEEILGDQIKHKILLEEILTKDAIVSEEEVENYYKRNKALFMIPTSYHISQILVETKDEADQTMKELNQGSSFSVLAMERSIEEFSSVMGGNIGYVNEEDERVSKEGLKAIKKLKQGKWTQPLKTKHGYVIYHLHDVIPQEKFTYKEVKNQIRRQIALEQMDMAVTADIFWEEAKVDWFYGKKGL